MWLGMMIRWAIVCVVALVALTAVARAQTPVERGDYLVNGIMACGNCHTPKGPGGVPQNDKLLSGGLRFNEAPFDVTGSNITPDPETGIGRWSDADIKKLLTTGVRPDGVQVAPIMPYGFYKGMMPKDLDAVVVYLKSIPAVKNQVVAPVYKMAAHATPYPDAQKATVESDLRDPVARGRYLAMLGHCMECHTPMAQGRHEFDKAGKGGREFNGPWGVSVSSNITSSKKSGLGNADVAAIKRAITEGIGHDGRRLKPPMDFPAYARITGQDLDALVAWVRSLPPLD
jgi:mono/diheme cytochrome c family protein